MKSYYEVIGISPSASDYEICAMYAKWIKSGQCDDTETREAYRVLMSSDLRQEYDKSIGIPEQKVPISMLSQEIRNAAEREKATHGNYTTALCWVIAVGPILGAVLYPEYFAPAPGMNFPQSLLGYICAAFIFFLPAALYMVLVAVCSSIKDNKSKKRSIVVAFAVCAFLFCIIQAAQ